MMKSDIIFHDPVESKFMYNHKFVDPRIHKKTSSLFNDTQLMCIVECVVNFIDELMDAYKERVEDLLFILKTIKAYSTFELCSDPETRASFVKCLHSMVNKKNTPDIRLLAISLGRMGGFCRGEIKELQLQRLQSGPVTKEQKQEIKNIIGEYCHYAIESIEQNKKHQICFAKPKMINNKCPMISTLSTEQSGSRQLRKRRKL